MKSEVGKNTTDMWKKRIEKLSEICEYILLVFCSCCEKKQKFVFLFFSYKKNTRNLPALLKHEFR